VIGSDPTLAWIVALAWIVRLGHACLWGGLFIVAAALVCRLLPRLPARVRAGLWWLACLKLVFDLCWTVPITLPVLPAPTQPRLAAQMPLALAPSSSVLSVLRVSGAKTVSASSFVNTEPISFSSEAFFSWPALLLAGWLAGVLLSLAVLFRQGRRLKQMVQTASAASLGQIAALDPSHLATALGLRFTPRILSHPSVTAPCVTGWLRPVILLPPDLALSLAPEELRLTLAHEMAHVKRDDLLQAALPTLARVLFFFHPLVWWAVAEWAAAREEACDALALQATGASTTQYGRLLLKMASGHSAPPALGLSAGYHGLRRRLLGLSRDENRRLPARFLLACVLPLLFPWRLTAASRPAAFGTEMGASRLSVYQVTDLGELTSGDLALNDSGQVAGTASDPSSQTHALLWSGGQSISLGALPKHHASLAYGLNRLGEVAAASYNLPGRGRAFLWDGSRHRLGSLPGYPYSEARAVNDSGQAAGIAETGGHDRWRAQIAHAFFWQSGQMTDLGTLGGAYSSAYGLNNSGVVVGKADTAVFGQTHAFTWADGAMQDLGTLGGANSLAYHINNGGTVVGYSETGDGETRHAFLSTDGQMRDLGALPSLTNTIAYDVNSLGDAVGAAAPAPDAPATRALLWHNGQIIDLNRLLPAHSGWTLEEARAINNRGQIAGQGHFHGQARAFLLTPR
jgi:probable HAF family extracellular repeat protein